MAFVGPASEERSSRKRRAAVDRGRDMHLAVEGIDCMRFAEERKFQQEVHCHNKSSLPHQVQAQLRCWKRERGTYSRAPRELGVARDILLDYVDCTYLRDDLQAYDRSSEQQSRVSHEDPGEYLISCQRRS